MREHLLVAGKSPFPAICNLGTGITGGDFSSPDSIGVRGLKDSSVIISSRFNSLNTKRRGKKF